MFLLQIYTLTGLMGLMEFPQEHEHVRPSNHSSKVVHTFSHKIFFFGRAKGMVSTETTVAISCEKERRRTPLPPALLNNVGRHRYV